MQISKDQELEYILTIKQFVNSSAWQEYALPMITTVLQKELPKPDSKDWEVKYRYAFALSDAFTLILNTLTNLSSKDEFMKNMERVFNPIDES